MKYILLLMLMAACSSSMVEGYYNFPNNTWKRFENPEIDIKINRPGIFYDMYIEIEYKKDLAPAFMPVSVITSTPDGEIRSRNLRIDLDQADGIAREILRKDFAFAEAGICNFEIENRSQQIETRGMKKIRIILERVE